MESLPPHFDDVLERALRSIPGCAAVGCVDTRLGLLLCAKVVPERFGDAMEMVAAATGELFRDAGARAIEAAFSRSSGDAAHDEPRLQQVFALSRDYLYVYQALMESPELVLATVCRADANLGMVLARARATLVELRETVPST
jgi:hypothetical protein